jgi:hypothetical protein
VNNSTPDKVNSPIHFTCSNQPREREREREAYTNPTTEDTDDSTKHNRKRVNGSLLLLIPGRGNVGYSSSRAMLQEWNKME